MLRLHNNLRRLIFSTLAYFEIFEFPLTKEELYHFLHTSTPVAKETFEEALTEIPHKNMQGATFYFLSQHNIAATKRRENTKISEKKLKNATNLIKFLGLIPTIAFIGISGSLAMKNGDEDSDIDLFIITMPNTLWITRFLVWVSLLFTFKQRKRNSQGRDSICVNMFLDRAYLRFPQERQDIYTAHEIVQLVPIVNKYKTHELFLEENAWVLTYLAHGFKIQKSKNTLPFGTYLLKTLSLPFEKLAMWLQLLYMRRHKTVEQTTDTFIAFHPYDYRDTIIKEFGKKMKKYAI